MGEENGFFAVGLGIGTCNSKGEWLEAYFPKPLLRPTRAEVAGLTQCFNYQGGPATLVAKESERQKLARLAPPWQSLAEAKGPVALVVLTADAPPSNVLEAYLKLHLLSHRLVRPNSINLAGIFRVLPNVAWTSEGPIDAQELDSRQLEARLRGRVLNVHSIDKFPAMTDYVVPSGVRIADSARVRLGAYVGAGTTVMQAGFINFNAGAEGPGMIEGRVSSSVWVESGSDLGGGSSTMGVLSGGNSQPISVGKSCLIGANAGTGIPLGDDCTIESGLYLTAASKVRVLAGDGSVIQVVKARELAGKSGLVYRRNSENGQIECLPSKKAIQLNQDLHAHN